MEKRLYAHQYSEKELQAMTEIQLINLRCESPLDVKALSKVLRNGRKYTYEPKKITKNTKVKTEIDEEKLKEDLARMKEINKFDEALQEEIEELERNFDAVKAKKLIDDIMT
jgi:hypothetical protein